MSHYALARQNAQHVLGVVVPKVACVDVIRRLQTLLTQIYECLFFPALQFPIYTHHVLIPRVLAVFQNVAGSSEAQVTVRLEILLC